jgi:hypothetical protein
LQINHHTIISRNIRAERHVKREFRRVVEHQYSAVARCEAITRGLEMTCKDVSFIDTLVGEKAIRCLGIRPVLASHGYACAYCVADLLEQSAKSPAQPNVLAWLFSDLCYFWQIKPLTRHVPFLVDEAQNRSLKRNGISALVVFQEPQANKPVDICYV